MMLWKWMMIFSPTSSLSNCVKDIVNPLVEVLVFLDVTNKQEYFLEQKMEVEIVAIGGRIELDVLKNK